MMFTFEIIYTKIFENNKEYYNIFIYNLNELDKYGYY
ncbi:MAG: hypothetical protein K0R72_898 [Clostridia bacterium]|jgi:hypothetical protein|nr:hypothetical protein [Clostridia bacterium]